MPASLSYHEPAIALLLKQASFLVVLNLVNHVLDSLLYVGLVGQILVGIAWGIPGGRLLSVEFQQVTGQLGYLGLILIVFEGGLSTSFSAFKSNMVLSTLVATTGVVAPIAASFVLTSMAGASPLQAFAAGAALCSTSLGTTFTLLSNSGLTSTKLGVVITSAAMLDDVVGLIMVQVIANLGSFSVFQPVIVFRPVLVSLAFGILLPTACRWIILPVAKSIMTKARQDETSWLATTLRCNGVVVLLHLVLLSGMVAGATLAGTSSLLGAYIAGAIIGWWDDVATKMVSEVPTPSVAASIQASSAEQSPSSGTNVRGQEQSVDQITQTSPTVESPLPKQGEVLFDEFLRPVLQRILKPFFFASIGFSIPITKMFTASVVWRGVVYALLMMITKLLCGIWLIRLHDPWYKLRWLAQYLKACILRKPNQRDTTQSHHNSQIPKKPISLYPGSVLGCAMVARGEIGYLISSLAESHGVLGSVTGSAVGEPSEMFLIVTWAITLCTIMGPVCTGILVRRVRRLEGVTRANSRKRHEVLGSWGMN